MTVESVSTHTVEPVASPGTSVRHVNDVDLGAVSRLASRIQADAAIGKTLWKAEVSWTGAFRSEFRSRHLPPVRSDEPDLLGGGDTAPNPAEQLLGALGNCLAVGYAANASAAGITIHSLRIALDGEIDLAVVLGLRAGNAGYESIRAKVHLDADGTPEQLLQLHDKVVGTSPVGHTLGRAVPVKIELAGIAEGALRVAAAP